ncbi:hypothetical protein [Paracoccus sp. (in: a-proteobacteria)]|uniref:hypothetical protein n=1 Tax=Paracoccus sp. TaxID=267 RepID=UPI003A858C11
MRDNREDHHGGAHPDLTQRQIEGMIPILETLTGRAFDPECDAASVASGLGLGVVPCSAGLWFDTSFYRAFEELGAPFVWSMCLPFAADGYISSDHRDPPRWPILLPRMNGCGPWHRWRGRMNGAGASR